MRLLREPPTFANSVPVTAALLVVMAGLALAPGAARAQQEAQSPPEGQPSGTPNAQEAMQGGGVTDERSLDDQRAREHFHIGTTFYDAGRFAEAAEEFEEAFRLSNRPRLLFNAYVAHRDANDLEAAARTLRGYLESDEEITDRVNLEARLQAMEATVEERRRTMGHNQQLQQQLAAAQRQPEYEDRPGELWPWIVAGGGAALMVVGIATGVVASDGLSGLQAECPLAGRCFSLTPDEVSSRRGDITTMATVTDAMLFGGGAVLVGGLVLGLVFGLDRRVQIERGASSGGSSPEEDSAEPEAGLSCGPYGCTATLQGRF